MKSLFILNQAAYDSEQTYNALRLANTLANREQNTVRIYLFGDAVMVAQKGQHRLEKHYNLEQMRAACRT
jgi:uncharacterized protein involved in oxidation of intracellular sulfur